MAAHEFTVHRAVASARITYVALGALTNLALAMEADPGLAQRLAGLVHMGGSFDPPGGEPFEWTTPDIPAAIWRETLRFNTLFDPEASALVFRSGIPLTLIPANVTAKVFQRLPDIDRLEAAGTPYHRFLAAYGRPWINWSTQVRGLPGAHMHDPLTVAALIAPDLFRFQRMRLEPEALLNGTIPWLTHAPGGIRARVAVEVDATRFEAFLADRLCQPVLPRYRL
jgi:purine nucleosidase